jgi:hypothetical protein
MFSLLEGAQKKFTDLLDYVAQPEPEKMDEQMSSDDTKPVEEVSINTAAIAGKVLSYAKLASSTAQEKANKLSTFVSNAPVFENLTKQQDQFKKSLTEGQDSDVPLPWEGLPNEEGAKQRFLALSHNPQIFLEDPPVMLEENPSEFGLVAKKLLEHDENLSKLRYELVPKK